MFMKKIREQDKLELKKILRGEFKNGKGKDHSIDIMALQNTEQERIARMEECLKVLQDRDQGYDESDSEQDGNDL